MVAVGLLDCFEGMSKHMAKQNMSIIYIYIYYPLTIIVAIMDIYIYNYIKTIRFL